MAIFSWMLCTFLACERSEKTDIEPVSVDADGDGFAFEEDCDDTNPVTYPGADEVCDGVDNDCDGVVDAQDPDIADAITQYEDADGDGAGGGYAIVTCTPIEGYVSSSEDCDDLDSNTHPGADEVCDEIDNNCDGEIDEGVALRWYADADFDGYGDADNTVQACQEPPGYVYNALDCDDLSASTHPGSYEICDGVDNDCDGEIDENAINANRYYLDEDLDGYGDPAVSTTACALPEGYSDSADDCDDSNDAIHPAASELCDGYDNNCDSLIDGADATDATAWYLDFDVDGFGNPLISMKACSQPSGYVTDSTDCDDVNTEAYPGADEICDLMDNDCDGDIDENDAVDATTWYLDSDSDGYGIDVSQQACNQPTGYVDNSTDCNDSDVTISPGAAEVCD
ncbi:MAG: putative metal-binding motif-containing protein, partial [Myxococcota bacterium]|nr:putative metal-binding motif-containing protein [Myxococcota bacterium]